MKTNLYQSPDRQARTRRGVLLLVVLSLLALFALVGITFVLVSSQYYKTTIIEVRNEQYGDNPEKLLDAAMAQFVRGTNNPMSVARGGDLLTDMYGNDGVRGVVTASTADPKSGGQFIDLTASSTGANAVHSMFSYPIPNPANPTVTIERPIVLPAQMQTPGYFNGCVLTLLDGPAANRSTRIVGWMHSAGTYTIRVLAFDGANAAAGGPVEWRFIVNGRPFNGTGSGFNPTADAAAETFVNALEPVTFTDGLTTRNFPYALLPNPVYFKAVPALPEPVAPLAPYPYFGGVGGLDEEYDIADLQNPALAYIPLNPTMDPNNITLLPSFHRPDLVWHMGIALDPAFNPTVDRDAWKTMEPAVLRRIMLRPVGGFPAADHEQFTGSNPTFHPIFGPFDVDNDGDGVRESVWLDIGLPVRTAPDGRMYKPLVAPLIVDLDGRLNVNAHGTIAHVDSNYVGPQTASTGADGVNLLPEVFPGGVVGGPFPNLPRGQGYGPPEISLLPVFNQFPGVAPPGPATAVVQQYANLLAERYKEPNTNLPVLNPNYAVADYTAPLNAPRPGISFLADPLAGVRFTDYPRHDINQPSSYTSPPDVHGQGMFALDVRGMPVELFWSRPDPRRDKPYELNLSRKAVRDAASPTSTPTAIDSSTNANAQQTPNPVDSPFSVAELERVLRMYDIDAAELPDRLRRLIDPAANGLGAGVGPPLAITKNMITTDGFDVPSPAVLPTRDIRDVALKVSREALHSVQIADLLRVRLLRGGVPEADVPMHIQKMLPPEVIAGLKMDLNRPFGDGRDNGSPSGNGIVDEPSETGEAIWDSATSAPFPSDIWPDITNGRDLNDDGEVSDADKLLARHMMARHLYVMMLLLMDEGASVDLDGDPTTGGPIGAAETKIAIAQWAVNVVDFRDRDSIMTGFEFDMEPFDGWDVDGDLSTTHEPDRRVVWGCERPELLMTETLAFHDRRTEDLSSESVDPSDGSTATMGGTTSAAPPDRDLDFDQRLVPRGSLFVELYNPWVTQASTVNPAGIPAATEASGEFYGVNAATNTAPGVILNGFAPGDAPVWRILIVRATENTRTKHPKDPDDPLNERPISQNVFPVPNTDEVERSIYFRPIPPGFAAYHGQPYWTTLPLPPVFPGRYAVVGSTGIIDTDKNPVEYVTTIGRQQNTGSDTTQDGINARTPTTRQITLMPSTNANLNQVKIVNGNEPPLADMLPVVAIPINRTLDGTGNPTPLTGIGARSISVSEPLQGYPTAGLAPTTNGPGVQDVQYTQPHDIPLDRQNAIQTDPTILAALADNGVWPAFRVLHLQRLANPLAAYDPQLNPYRTIDVMSVNLTKFNGVTSDDDPSQPTVDAGIASWQRGDTDAIAGNNSLWRHESHKTPPAHGPLAPMLADPHNYNFTLRHSLGFLNNNFAPLRPATDVAATAYPNYRGSPMSPFPWLTWLNRPFAGPLELLLVPRSQSSTLLFDYTAGGGGMKRAIPEFPYADPSIFVAGDPVPPGSSHLFDFFQSVPTPPAPLVPNFHRILEYVQVPSRFVGTDTHLNPTQQRFGRLNTATPVAEDPQELAMMSFHHAPFNKVSNYRDPGRININTIPSDTGTPASPTSTIWNGVLNGYTEPRWDAVHQSRMGRAGFDPTTTPSYFSNPFRSAAGASLLLPDAGGTVPLQRDDIDVTLLRPHTPETNAPATDRLLFDYTSMTGSGADDPTRNPYFRIQNLQRLSNLVTTRSNVYAIWITVGYFEVAPHNDLAIHPDGYQLKQEMGSETGEIKRHRAFYIYDRTIPVAHEPGKDHNFQDGLLLRRFIE